MSRTLKLGVNLDHVATLRQARYALTPDTCLVEPSLLDAVEVCRESGADSITLHLREDRRHIQDDDVRLVSRKGSLPLNLEMGNTPGILERALEVVPQFVCLVPENRKEITTEGGLAVVAEREALAPTIQTLRDVGVKVSLFVDPEPDPIRAAADLGAEMVELHTGAFANGALQGSDEERDRLTTAAVLADSLGLQVNAGHGIRMENLPLLLTVPHLAELNVGHHLVSRSVFVGLERAVREMLDRMASYEPDLP